MELRPGLKLKSVVCSTEVIIVSAASADFDISCGGVSMIEATAEAPGAVEAVAGLTEGTLLGKRYCDADATIEVLCVKPGDGSMGIGQTAMTLKEAKPLPASD